MSVSPNTLFNAILEHGNCSVFIEMGSGGSLPYMQIKVTPGMLTALAPDNILTETDVKDALLRLGLQARLDEPQQISVPASPLFAYCHEHNADSSALENALGSEIVGGAATVSAMVQRYQERGYGKRGQGG